MFDVCRIKWKEDIKLAETMMCTNVLLLKEFALKYQNKAFEVYFSLYSVL